MIESLNTVEEELGKAGKEVLTVEQLKELKQRVLPHLLV